MDIRGMWSYKWQFMQERQCELQPDITQYLYPVVRRDNGLQPLNEVTRGLTGVLGKTV